MSDMLSIGQSGVAAYSRALEVLADNVANAATPGHVRRVAEFSPANQGGGQGPLELDPGGASGVRLSAIRRAVDALQMDSLRRAEADVASLEAAGRWLRTVEAAVTGPASIDAPLTELFASLSDLAGDPANPAVRQTVLARADALAGQFNRSGAELGRIEEELAADAAIEVRTLNDLSQAVADINGRLRRTTDGTAAAAALADTRDRLLARMAGITTIHVALDARGQAEVRVADAGGPLLVSASDAVSARLVPLTGGFQMRVGPEGADAPATLVSGALAGLSLARGRLVEAAARLDDLASRLAAEFNAAHAQGVDLAGADGGAFFTIAEPRVSNAKANGGSARMAASYGGAGPLPPMTLGFDGTQWTLARDDGGGTVSGTLPLSLDGVEVSLAGGAARPGDLFRIGPARPAEAIRLADLSPAQLATAQRWVSEPGPVNAGSGRLTLEVAAPLVPPASAPFRVSMTAGQLVLTDSLGAVLGTGVPGDWIQGDGFRARVDGAPAEGDLFDIRRNGPGSGGNGNALRLLAVRDGGGAQGTPGEQADALVGTIAVSLKAQRDLLETASESRNRVAEQLSADSGVDLNAEAAEMLRLQQAYGANARVIQAAREIFETLLQSSR